MGVRFEWEISEDDGREPGFKGRRPLSSLFTITSLIALAGLALAGWAVARHEAARSQAELMSVVQQVLDLERAAYRSGDGDLFFSVQDTDPAWRAAQLRPENQAANRAGLAASQVRDRGQELWANISWSAEGQDLQRIAFFRRSGLSLVHVPTSADYWGSLRVIEQEWGKLHYFEADQPIAWELAARVGDLVATFCEADACPAGRLPFVLTLAGDFSITAAPNQVRLPSPRLLALDDQGRPADLFWQRLEQDLVDYLTPAHVRFAVPEDPIIGGVDPVYEQLAEEFSRSRPDITVEIINLADLPADPFSWAAEVDGAAVTPDANMLAAGLAADLTDFATTDPGFEAGDFYEQIWQGAWWLDRMWFVPQSAGMKLLYYDVQAYRRAGLEAPMLHWTWAEMEGDLARLPQTFQDDYLLWAFLDAGPDSLLSYAYNRDGGCEDDAVTGVQAGAAAECREPLQNTQVTAALEWFLTRSAAPGQMPDLTGLTGEERAFKVINVFFPRRVVLWVDEPVAYELHFLRQPVGVVPFPGSDRFDGTTPLWVEGSFISQFSARPRATWQWLNFLSRQSLAKQKRLVPARPSVAAETGYWARLPRPLGEAMRSAFPFARTVTIDEKELFTWERLEEVLDGRVSPQEAAQTRPRLRWFR